MKYLFITATLIDEAVVSLNEELEKEIKEAISEDGAIPWVGEVIKVSIVEMK